MLVADFGNGVLGALEYFHFVQIKSKSLWDSEE